MLKNMIRYLILLSLTVLVIILVGTWFDRQPSAELPDSTASSGAETAYSGQISVLSADKLSLPAIVELELGNLSPADHEKLEQDPQFRAELKGKSSFEQKLIAARWADGIRDNFCRQFLEVFAQRAYDLEGVRKLKEKSPEAGCPQRKSPEATFEYVNAVLEWAFDDPYTEIRAPEQARKFEEMLAGGGKRHGSVGVRFSLRPDDFGIDGNGRPIRPIFHGLVNHVVRESPAYKAGLKDGDYILKIDGEDVIGADYAHVSEDLLAGEDGSSLKLTVKRGKEIFEKDIIRGTVNSDAVWTRDLGDGIFAVIVTEWREGVHPELYEALVGLKRSGARGIVIDLRDNLGGLFNEAVLSSSFLVRDGVLVKEQMRVQKSGTGTGSFIASTWERRAGKLLRVDKDEASGETSTAHLVVAVYSRDPKSGKEMVSPAELPFVKGLPPVVILGNGMSASASEVFIGAVIKKQGKRAKTRQGAHFIGTRSAGKGIAQCVMPGPSGTSVSVTCARYYLPDGSWPGDAHNHRYGIQPELTVEQAPDALSYSPSDTQLNAAIKFLKNR